MRYARAMISVLIECRNQEAALAATLAALVPGAVEGLVRDVIVVDRGSTDGTERVAEAAGCRFMARATIGEAVNAARGEWLLCLEPGACPQPGWIDALSRHMAEHDRPAYFRRAKARNASLLERLRMRRSPLGSGLFLAKTKACEAAVSATSLRGLAKITRGRRMKLDGALTPAARRRA